MKKNLNFLLKYLGPNDETVSRQLEAAITTSIKKIRVQIQKEIQQFNEREIILIHHNQIVEDSQTLEQLSQQGDVIILILPKIVSINIIFGRENPKRIDMDITLPIKDTIEKFLKSQKIRKKGNLLSFYSLAYEKKLYPALSEKELKKKKQKQKKKKGVTKYQTCCITLPIYAHKWWYSNFYLIRRLSLEDNLIQNEEELMFLIDQAQFSASLGLCAYKVENWAELISFQIYFHEDEATSIKEKIEEYTPPFIDCSPKLIQARYKDIKSYSRTEAEKKYIIESILNGCQCSYIENVKMKWMRFWYKYKIFISSMNVMIFSGNGKNFQYMKEIGMIESVQLQGVNIYSNFSENENKNEVSTSIQENESVKNENQDQENNDQNLNNNIKNDNSNNNGKSNNDDNFNSNINLNLNSSSNEISFFFSSNNNNENASGITIYFKDNTNWELSCDSQPAASRLKFVLDYMITIFHKNESNFLEKDISLSSTPSTTITNNNNNNNSEEEELSEQLNILGEKLGTFNPSESFDISSQSLFNLPLSSKNQYTQYPHYSVIITPEEIEDKVVFKGYNEYNQGNEFNFLKANIPSIKIQKNDKDITKDDLPINNNDPLLSNFFALGPNEKGNRYLCIIIIVMIITFYYIFKHYFSK